MKKVFNWDSDLETESGFASLIISEFVAGYYLKSLVQDKHLDILDQQINRLRVKITIRNLVLNSSYTSSR